jgi:hypothetical protein
MDKPVIKFIAQIKRGAVAHMDFQAFKWPYYDKDVNAFFTVEYNGRYFDCKAHGYGERGSSESYGSGSVLVWNMEDFVPHVDLNFVKLAVFEHQKNKILEQIVKKAKELDDLRISYETLLTNEPKLVI